MIGRPSGCTAGFSAVELLITLFIAVAFITSGYQLYTVIIKDSGDTRSRATASNIAYDNLRRYSPQVTSPCSTPTPAPTPAIPTGSNLSNPSITVTISCPYGTTVGLSKIQVSVKYGTSSPQQEVLHALFINS